MHFAPFALGFRPFFLGAALWAVVDILLWLTVYRGVDVGPLYYDPLTWHAHEMVFGFTAAVLAGFLLTAAGNWSGHPTPKGPKLAALFSLWLAGRLAPLGASLLPAGVIAGIDCAFLPCLIIALVPALRRGKLLNWIFPLMLLGLTAANALVHAQVLEYSQQTARTGLYISIYFVVLMIQVMGGRVIPFFTGRSTEGATPTKRPWLDQLAIGLYIVFVIVDLMGAPATLTRGVALAAAAAHTARLFGWCVSGVWSKPLLWILYLAYAWIIAGLILRVLPVSPFATIHAFTAGTVGVMCLGMMTRVSRGHTGRPLETDKIAVSSFVLINLAALLRVGGTMTGSSVYVWAISISAVLWAIAYALFLFGHTKMLTHSRPDGKSG